MKLNVEFSKLHIAAAKMKGLESLVNELRKTKGVISGRLGVSRCVHSQSRRRCRKARRRCYSFDVR